MYNRKRKDAAAKDKQFRVIEKNKKDTFPQQFFEVDKGEKEVKYGCPYHLESNESILASLDICDCVSEDDVTLLICPTGGN